MSDASVLDPDEVEAQRQQALDELTDPDDGTDQEALEQTLELEDWAHDEPAAPRDTQST